MGNKLMPDDIKTQDAELLETFQKSLEMLREILAFQCSDGNWNYSPYMHGMTNGMIFALSLFDNKRPEYLDAPDEWGYKKDNVETPIKALRDLIIEKMFE